MEAVVDPEANLCSCEKYECDLCVKRHERKLIALFTVIAPGLEAEQKRIAEQEELKARIKAETKEKEE